METTMTAGSPAKIIFNFMVPICLGNLFQQIYTMVDTVIVGRFVGTTALAAVGSTGTINFLILGFLMGLTAGITVLTSQRFGAGDIRGMRKTVGSAISISIAASVIMTIFSMIFMKPLLHLMNTPDDMMQDAYTYILIICGGIFASVMYNLFAGVLRALGNSKVPLYFLIFSAMLNIVLDLALILLFHMGVAGAAWATIISQGVSAVLCFLYIRKKVPLLLLSREDFRPQGLLIKNQLSVGLPMALQYSITAIGTLMVQSSLNTFGSLHVAAFTAASKSEQIVGQFYVAMGAAMATYAAQNVGAGRIDRVRQGFRSATIMGVIYSVIAGVVVFFFGYLITGLFVSENLAEISPLVDIYMRCSALFFIPLAIVNLYRNGLQGMGFGIMPMMAGVAELVGRGASAMAASHYNSYTGICMASPIAWILAAALLLIMYSLIMKKYKTKKAV